MELTHPRVKRHGQAALVMELSDDLIGRRQASLPFLPAARSYGTGEVRPQLLGAPGRGERGAQPLAVRRIDPIHQQAQLHQFPDLPSRDDRRAEIVADLTATPDEGLLLGQL